MGMPGGTELLIIFGIVVLLFGASIIYYFQKATQKKEKNEFKSNN